MAGPKKPWWGCKCGEGANWACRLACRACGRQAPRSIADAARANAEAKPGAKVGGKPGRVAPTTSGGPQPRQVPAGKASGRTFADVVRALGLGQNLPPTSDDPMDAAPSMPEEAAAQWRYWKDRRAAAARAGEFGKHDLAVCDKELADLQAAARASRPWAARVQAATHRSDRARQQREEALADVAAARAALAHLEGVLVAAEAEVEIATKELAAVQAEALPEGAAPASPTPDLDRALATLVQAASSAGVGLEALAERVAAAALAGAGHGRSERSQEIPPEQVTPPTPTLHPPATPRQATPCPQGPGRSRSRGREVDDGVSEAASEDGRGGRRGRGGQRR